MENISSVTIDYRYIVSLIQNYMPSEDELIVEPIEDEGIDKHIEKLRETNPALAEDTMKCECWPWTWNPSSHPHLPGRDPCPWKPWFSGERMI